VGITVSHVSVCITQLERHNLVGHQLIEIQGSNRRHRGYFTVDGARLKRSCPDCRGEMVLYGFRGDTLIQRCNACGRRVDVPPYVPKAQKER
jgi:ribosomal protein S27E